MSLAPVVEAARNDPNVFIEYVLDLDQAGVHEEIQDHLTDHVEPYCEEHRGIGKTTQIAGRVAFECGHDATIRVKYVQQSIRHAKDTVDMIRRILESPRCRHVFPDLRPDATLWGKEAFRLLSSTIQRDPTVEACGIFGHAGGRADLLVFDDICDLDNSIRQASKREQVKEAYSNTWRKMLSGDRRRVWRIGTPWHTQDITADWREECRANGTLLRHPVEDYRSPWSDEWTADRLRDEEVRGGPLAYARAFGLEPISSDMLLFPAEWLDDALYEKVPDREVGGGHHVAAIDWAFTEERQRTKEGKKKGDPDWSVCLVAWRSRRGHLYVRDMVRVKESFPAFKRKALDICQRYEVNACYAEANGPQKGLVDQLRLEATFPVVPMERGPKAGVVTRGYDCQPYVESGRYHLLARKDETGILTVDPRLKDHYDEMAVFPAGGHDDTVSAAMDLMIIRRSQTPEGFETGEVKPQRDRLDRVYGRGRGLDRVYGSR